MNPKTLLALSLLSAGLVFSQASLRADDPQTPPPQPPSATVNPSADGQTPPPPHRRMHRPLSLEQLSEKLNLTADQQKTIGPILASARTQAKELRGDDSISHEDKRAKMKEIASASKAQIRAVLTPDQQKLFDALPERGEKQVQSAPEGGAPSAPSSTQ